MSVLSDRQLALKLYHELNKRVHVGRTRRRPEKYIQPESSDEEEEEEEEEKNRQTTIKNGSRKNSKKKILQKKKNLAKKTKKKKNSKIVKKSSKKVQKKKKVTKKKNKKIKKKKKQSKKRKNISKKKKKKNNKKKTKKMTKQKNKKKKKNSNNSFIDDGELFDDNSIKAVSIFDETETDDEIVLTDEQIAKKLDFELNKRFPSRGRRRLNEFTSPASKKKQKTSNKKSSKDIEVQFDKSKSIFDFILKENKAKEDDSLSEDDIIPRNIDESTISIEGSEGPLLFHAIPPPKKITQKTAAQQPKLAPKTKIPTKTRTPTDFNYQYNCVALEVHFGDQNKGGQKKLKKKQENAELVRIPKKTISNLQSIFGQKKKHATPTLIPKKKKNYMLPNISSLIKPNQPTISHFSSTKRAAVSRIPRKSLSKSPTPTAITKTMLKKKPISHVKFPPPPRRTKSNSITPPNHVASLQSISTRTQINSNAKPFTKPTNNVKNKTTIPTINSTKIEQENFSPISKSSFQVALEVNRLQKLIKQPKQ